jgi:hypothetical protein
VSAILAPQQLFGAPIYASMNSDYGFLPYRNLTDGVTTLDNSLSRIDIAPSLRVPLSTLTYLSVNTSVIHNLSRYSRSEQTNASGSLVEVSQPLIRDYTDLRTEIVGPTFTKIWDTPDSGYSERMKHLIEPAFTLDYTTPITVAATFEAGVLVLRPRDAPGVEVRRWREGDQMVWSYHTLFTTGADLHVRLHRRRHDALHVRPDESAHVPRQDHRRRARPDARIPHHRSAANLLL